MSKSDKILQEINKIAESLPRLYDKVDSINDNQVTKSQFATLNTRLANLEGSIMKVLYGLLGIIGATIGSKFIPQSPIDVYGGIVFASKFLAIFSWIFVTTVLVMKAKKMASAKEQKVHYIAGGFAIMSLSFIMAEFIPSVMTLEGLFILRVLYSALFILYGLKTKISED